MKAAKRLKADKDFSPCPAEAGDEIYPNGIFHFNITKMMEYIEQNPGNISLEDVPVKNLDAQLSTLNEDHVPLVDITKPIILAEIAPGL
ncbi:MAG: hypothetical protein R6V55_07090 [Desulfovermiculus sp.]